jgi:hypothetical protein
VRVFSRKHGSLHWSARAPAACRSTGSHRHSAMVGSFNARTFDILSAGWPPGRAYPRPPASFFAEPTQATLLALT